MCKIKIIQCGNIKPIIKYSCWHKTKLLYCTLNHSLYLCWNPLNRSIDSGRSTSEYRLNRVGATRSITKQTSNLENF